LPEGARFRFGTVRYRCGEGIDNSALSPDGKLLATMGRSGIVVWELSSGRPVHRLTHRASAFQENRPAVCFSRDGNFLICLVTRAEVREFTMAEREPRVRKWDLRSGKEVSNVRLADDPSDYTNSRDWSSCFGRDGKDLFIVTVEDGHLCMIDATTGKERWQYDTGPQRGGRLATFRIPIAVSPDGQTVAVGRGFNKANVLLLQTATGAEIRRIVTPMPVWGLCFSPDGGVLAVRGDEHAIVRTYDVKSGKERMAFRARAGEESVWDMHPPITFSHDGRDLFAATEGGNFLRFDVTSP
jgi:WD40 repeat protein